MRLNWKQKQTRLDWARRNPDKVRESNRLYRLGNWDKVTRQARDRMKRYRARNRNVTRHLES